MKISVFAFGKLKTPGLKEAAHYYRRLSQTWGGIDEIELKPISVSDKSAQTRKLIQEKEGALLNEKLLALGSRAAIYLLDETGKNLSTSQWAKIVAEASDRGTANLAFCVGSSLGFSDEVRAHAKGQLSLGAQTLPHELARVVLFEQIYRALSVLQGHPYHNSGS